MEFEFILPARHDELLNQTGINYCVARVLSKSECEINLKSEFSEGFCIPFPR